MTDLLIEGGTVITVDPTRRIIRDGAVAVVGNKIVAVGKAADLVPQYPNARRISARGKVVMPGLIDSHIHLTQMLARGLTDDIDGVKVRWSWDRVFPWEVKATPDDVYASSMLCITEMIKTGTTCFADPGGNFMDAAANAAVESGMRGIVGVASMDYSPPDWVLPEGFGSTSTEEALRQSEDLIQRWHGKADGRIRAWTGLRVEPNLSKRLIIEIAALARKYNVGVHTHANVSKGRADWVKKNTGLNTILYYDSLGALGPNWLTVHMGWITDEEVDLMRERDVKVCHCTGAALHGGGGAVTVGKFPEMIEKGITVALGTDSSAASNSLDMFREMYHMATLHKERRLDGTLISPEQAVEAATINGARALLWDDEIGSLEVGKKADIIIVDTQRSNWLPFYDFSLVPTLVYSGDGADVQTVVIDGKIVMEDRVLKTIDETAVLRKAQQAAEKLIAQLPYKLEPKWSFQ